MLNEREISKLKELLGDAAVITEDIPADFGHDELPGGAAFMPEAVVEPGSTAEVSEVLKLCAGANVPVTVRGAGTGQVGGSVPVKGGVVLSTKKMNAILGVDEAARTITVQPGALLQEVKAEAESHKLYYPPDPGEKTATIGGNAATNAGGPCAVKYGVTKDYVLDAVIVLADGTAARLSDKPEYAAVIGSEGTLAVITELTLKLIEKPQSDAILLLPFMDGESCIKAARTIMDGDFAPATVEYLDTDLVEFAGKVTGNPVFPVKMDGERVGATLMLTIEGEDEDSVMEKMETLAEMAEELECIDILVGDTPSMKRDFWAAHDAFHTSMESGAKCACEVNVNVPFDGILEFVEFAKAAGEENGLKVMFNAHLGSGGVHVHAVADCSKDEFALKAKGFQDAVYGKCGELGGDTAGEYGVGYAKLAYLGEQERQSFAAIKAELDPKGILNPGKVAE